MAGTSTSSRELDQTPTWAVAGVCAAMILISIVLEKFLHKVGMWLLHKHKKALFEALEKVKSELMIVGFISLLLTFFQKYIVKICISAKVADSMLPCPYDGSSDGSDSSEEEHRRRLLWYERRFLAGDSSSASCKAGYEPIISINGLHQLHILIFFLAVFHVLYSAITMTLGRLKIRGWKEWERETSSHHYEFSNDPSRFRLTHETSFVRAHTSFWTRIPLFFYVGCFFRQFFRSVSKADYLTLRNGFITVHIAPGGKFDFQKYIKRSLEDDFKVVVGVSYVLWASFVIFLLLNVNGWHTLFWASSIPLIITLAVGTKLQAILTKMALEITEKHAVVQGIPLVQGSDKYFWFGRPTLVLHLIHFSLFQNAFQITYFLWIWYSFGLTSCFNESLKLVIVKIALGFGALVLCSYITLPLYALVTQMGSNMKKSIFDEQTSKALKKWHMAVKKKQGGRAGRSPTRSLGSPTASPSPMQTSPVHPSAHTLHRFKTTGHSTHSISYDDREMSDLEDDPTSPKSSSTNLLVRIDHDNPEVEGSEAHPGQGTGKQDDFSFAKPALPK
ncbi:MLO-like protein 10 [Malania oleifera]|uniref:MLO-like protein 10 n=1 Tax=Malania oleifera TaxID=397392 RepID=UPI0025AEAFB8|nr:MLO-like protein 10 [Malania oleifera]XP_057957062.1 MLO-like protein 10 [Malania oleifera]XP_057957071.1 MLO-like protein 10 [Malania oleifera]